MLQNYWVNWNLSNIHTHGYKWGGPFQNDKGLERWHVDEANCGIAQPIPIGEISVKYIIIVGFENDIYFLALNINRLSKFWKDIEQWKNGSYPIECNGTNNKLSWRNGLCKLWDRLPRIIPRIMDKIVDWKRKFMMTNMCWWNWWRLDLIFDFFAACHTSAQEAPIKVTFHHCSQLANS